MLATGAIMAEKGAMTAQQAHDRIRQILAAGWAALPHDAPGAMRQADSVLEQLPGSVDATLLRAACLRRQGMIDAAHACLAPLMTTRPAAPIPWFEWGMIAAAMGDEDQAVHAFHQATVLAPGFTAAWRAMGDALLLLRAGQRADMAYAQAARAANRDAALAPAAAALCDNNVPAALAMLRGYVGRHPALPAALLLLAEAEIRAGNLSVAEDILQRCLAGTPGLAEARHTLATLFHVQGKHGQAAACFADLVERAPHNASLRMLLILSLTEIGDFAAAIPHCENLLAGHRRQPKLWLMYAHALKTMGRDGEAVAAYRNCIGYAPAWVAGAYLSLADVKTYRFDDRDILDMQAALKRVAADSVDAAQLHYAVGRAREQRADWAASFAQYAQGARIRRAGIRYDPGAMTAYAAAARAVFRPEFFASRRGWGCPSAAPILIVGMPRSGSTLVEQILASHSAVEGAGELEAIGRIAAELRAGRELASLPDTMSRLRPAALAQLGQRYLDETAQYRRAGRPHFIDKMPDNFLHAGLIHLMLPHARIIDVRRGAMASGWAAYKQFFQPRQTGQDYSYDLAEIGRYRRDYVGLMAHWQDMLPDAIHLLRYERLIEDTEAEIRALLDFCGLPFEPACLRFWETARAVQTPSAQQVRRPIFRDGLESWRPYEPWLGTLRAALGDALGEAGRD
jgi:tetratricopeptide (TPR) repeat protein